MIYKRKEIVSSRYLKLNLLILYVKLLCVIFIIFIVPWSLRPQRFIVYVNKGDHGFHNGEMDMKMIFRAFGPEFKRDFVAEPFDSIHIYPLMCRLLRIRSEPNNGSLLFTEDMLLQGGEDQHTHT